MMDEYEYSVRVAKEAGIPFWVSFAWIDDFDIARADCNKLRDTYGYESANVVKRRKAGKEEVVH
jgi:hypothetical protein